MLSEPLRLERIKVAIADLPPSLAGAKIVQLSDLHYDWEGKYLSEDLLAQAIAASNGEDPDLVVLTGDYITHDPSPIFPLARRLESLKSRAGTYAILGNHDIYYPFARQQVTRALTAAGITVLWNAIATPLGEGLPLVGLADLWSREFAPEATLARLHPAVPRLVLSHNPDTAEVLRQWRVDLQLSGHTHGGQIVIPGLGPAPYLWEKVRPYIPRSLSRWLPMAGRCSGLVKNWDWGQGWHQVGRNQLYVNRGLGSYFPGRFFCPPEVTVITTCLR